eukprot:COSAG02_NODE_5054_length_4687_cov_7.076504_3_plen_263_part_00
MGRLQQTCCWWVGSVLVVAFQNETFKYCYKQMMYGNKRQKTTHKNSSLRPIEVHSAVVVLECQDKHAYIQTSQDLSRDLCHHAQKTGSPFTRDHPFTGKILSLNMFPGNLNETCTAMAAEYIALGYTVCNEMECSPDVLATTFLMRMEPVLVSVQTYVLRCNPRPNTEYDTIYIGKTQNLSSRLMQHWTGTAAHWTREHKPIEVIEILMSGGSSYEEVYRHETELTLNYMRDCMKEHGPDAWGSVRGGKYTAIHMGKPHELY